MSDDDNTLTLKACAFIEKHIAERDEDLLFLSTLIERRNQQTDCRRSFGQAPAKYAAITRSLEFAESQLERAEDDTRVLNFILERLLDQPPKYQ